jgi:hypothetical protein
VDYRKAVAEALLCLLHNLGSICAVMCEYATYKGVKLTTPPHLLTVYVARPLRQNLLNDLEYRLQIQR